MEITNNLFDSLPREIDHEEHKEQGKKINGIAQRITTSYNDPRGLRGFGVNFSLFSNTIIYWAKICTYTIRERTERYCKKFFFPEVDNEVLIANEYCASCHPNIIDVPFHSKPDEDRTKPATKCSYQENKKKEANKIKCQISISTKVVNNHSHCRDNNEKQELEILTRGGYKIILDQNSSGLERIAITDRNGEEGEENIIELRSDSKSVSISTQKNLHIKAPNIEIEADETIKMKSQSTMTLNGSLININ